MLSSLLFSGDPHSVCGLADGNLLGDRDISDGYHILDSSGTFPSAGNPLDRESLPKLHERCKYDVHRQVSIWILYSI